ncbi:MAG: hypothetical protein M1530_02550 [Candidatus Marsarchaeota archaeon]|nr:hypothetical protein [Candidatus Marsarchaeota archaeon]
MWILPSKHAGKKLKKVAQALSLALPGSSFFPRGERSLERFQELAEREAEDTILVLSSPADSSSSFILRSRRLSGRLWAWAGEELAISNFKAAERPKAAADSAEPYALKAEPLSAKHLASFLGLRAHPLAQFYDDLPAFELEVKEKKSQPSSARLTFEGSPLLSFQYARRSLCGAEKE